jgi:hypothetical protein
MMVSAPLPSLPAKMPPAPPTIVDPTPVVMATLVRLLA